ncbi:MAG TPA: hypothetical protein VNR90_16535, partial [Vicinamibacterales bacterium]|nr:hypothetical protein [Vicinamibacterales bacterium]
MSSAAAQQPALAPAIASTFTAVPPYAATQEQVKARLRDVFDLPARRLDAAMELFDHAAVETRYSVEPIDRLGTRRPLGDIQDRYREHAFTLGRKVAGEALVRAGVAPADIDLIVTTSCTGIMIPSLDAYLVDELGLRADVRRLPITELGCAGGAAALARAHDFLVGFPDARALVIAVELPSLSMQRADLSPANLVSTALFGDGAAAAVLVGGAVEDDGEAGSVTILETLSHIWPRSTYALGFDLKDDGFHSVLSKDV